MSSTDCYRKVFDAIDHGPAWWFPLIGLTLFVTVLVVSRYLRGTPGGISEKDRRRFMYAFGAFALLLTVGSSVAIFSEWFSARRALRNGSTEVIDGQVVDFYPMPPNGKGSESFTVNGVRFEYSDSIITEGFNTTRDHGGPIQPNLHVRIHYIRSRSQSIILRLEIANPTNADGHCS